MGHIRKESNKTQVFKRFIVRPSKYYKATFACIEVTEQEANEIEKTLTLEVDGNIIPVYIEKEYVTIHTQNVIYARCEYDIK